MATAGAENDGQSNERERENKDAPEPLPAYDPDFFITRINGLNIQEGDDLLDRIMNGVQSSRRTATGFVDLRLLPPDRTIAY